MSNKTIEVRIADALKNDTTAADLAALLVEVEQALATAEQDAAATSKAAMDVTITPDPDRARASIELATLVVGRLQTALSHLQSRYQEAEASEFLSRWQADRDRVEVRRDKAAAEFSKSRELIERLAAIFSNAEAVDRDVSRINISAPSGQRHLQQVELIARSLASFNSSDRSIAASTTLLGFDGKTAWPPRQQGLGVAMAQAMVTSAHDARYSDNWHGAADAQQRRLSREQQRLAAWHKEEERLQQERLRHEDLENRKRRTA